MKPSIVHVVSRLVSTRAPLSPWKRFQIKRFQLQSHVLQAARTGASLRSR
jgi:hypothetical protein